MGKIKWKGTEERRERAKELYSMFKQVQGALEQGFDEAPGSAKTNALNTLTGLTNWNAATAAEKADALYLALALLYSVVAFIIGTIFLNGE
jgi:phage host-nuclease inhibitor protein Gam